MEDQGKAQNEDDQMIMVGREARKKPVYSYTFLFIYNKSWMWLTSYKIVFRGNSAMINIHGKLNFILQTIWTSQAFNITVRLSIYFYVLTTLNDSNS